MADTSSRIGVVPLAVVLLRALVAWLADLLAPPRCAACDAHLGRRAVFCGACAAAVVEAQRPDALVDDRGSVRQVGLRPDAPVAGEVPLAAFALFGGPVATALRRLKYHRRSDLAVPLGHLARRAAARDGLEAEVVVPVPLRPKRLAERGYNQAALLGAEVARGLGVPLAAAALERVRDTPQQALLGRAGRLANVDGAFRARAPARVRGRRVLLVDDVASTGATLTACAAALRAAGAAAVTALVVARAELS
jgi:ComF family protein